MGKNRAFAIVAVIIVVIAALFFAFNNAFLSWN